MIRPGVTVKTTRPLDMLALNLSLYGKLTNGDIREISNVSHKLVELRRDQRVTIFSDVPQCVYVLVSGLACISILSLDGRRQITKILLPGEFCNAYDAKIHAPMEGIDILAPAQLAAIPNDAFGEISSSATMQSALSNLVIEAAFSARSTIAIIGRGSARSRIAYFLSELARRMTELDLLDSLHGNLPLTQDQIADATGLTGVHVNRTLSQLRSMGLMSGVGTTVQIADFPRFSALAGLKYRE